jgi:hypothetical protein
MGSFDFSQNKAEWPLGGPRLPLWQTLMHTVTLALSLDTAERTGRIIKLLLYASEFVLKTARFS